jgi:hypothetical protein
MRVGKLLGGLMGAAALFGAGEAHAQVIALSAGFAPDPRVLSGVSGGPVQAAMVNATCRGYIPTAAQHRVFLQSPMQFFRVWVNSQADTTLLVRAPNGQVFCADDTWGTNPGVDIMGAMPGAYEVFVGSYGPGSPAGYTVGFSENRASTPTNMGMAQPQPTGYGQPPLGVATVVPPGGGYVQQPSGYGGAVAVPPGGYVQQQPGYPQPGYGPAGFPLSTGFLPDPRMFSGISGGPMPAQNMSPQCRGFVNTMPNQTLMLTTPFNFLRLWVRSQGDTTLIVRAPNGQLFCADDTYGVNPGVDLQGAMAGNYQIFVGSYSQGARFPYELAATEMPSSSPNIAMGGMGQYGQGGYAPPPNQGTPYGAISLTSGFLPDPQMRQGMSGGPIDAMSMNSSCRGHIGTSPDHVLYLNSPFNFLRVYASSQADTTLVIRGPNGEVFCNDDTFGFNPSVDMQGAQPGMYQVFVGSYSEGDTQPYMLGLTEMPNVHP